MLAALAPTGLAAVGLAALTAEVCPAAGWLVLLHPATASTARTAVAIRYFMAANAEPPLLASFSGRHSLSRISYNLGGLRATVASHCGVRRAIGAMTIPALVRV